MSSNGKNKGNKSNGNKGGVTHEVSTEEAGGSRERPRSNASRTRDKEEENKSMEGSVEESTQIGIETYKEFLDGIETGVKKKKTKRKKKKKEGTQENHQWDGKSRRRGDFVLNHLPH